MKKRIVTAGAAALAVVVAVALAVRLIPGGTPAAQAALAQAEYPSMAPYPVEEEYYDEASGQLDYDRYSEDWDAWRKSRTALRSDLDGTALAPFLTASAKELLAEVTEAVTTAVTYTSQTYVDTLKKDGIFNKEAQMEALQKAKDKALALLSESAKDVLAQIHDRAENGGDGE